MAADLVDLTTLEEPKEFSGELTDQSPTFEYRVGERYLCAKFSSRKDREGYKSPIGAYPELRWL